VVHPHALHNEKHFFSRTGLARLLGAKEAEGRLSPEHEPV
jgi:hypothetical protein